MTHDKTQAALDGLAFVCRTLGWLEVIPPYGDKVDRTKECDKAIDMCAVIRHALTAQAKLEAINKELLEAARELIDFDDTNIICDAQGDSGTWQSKELEEIIRKISVAVRQAIALAEKARSE